MSKNLTINEKDLFHALVMIERYNEIAYKGTMNEDNPRYYQTYEKIRKLWWEMYCDSEYTLTEIL